MLAVRRVASRLVISGHPSLPGHGAGWSCLQLRRFRRGWAVRKLPRPSRPPLSSACTRARGGRPWDFGDAAPAAGAARLDPCTLAQALLFTLRPLLPTAPHPPFSLRAFIQWPQVVGRRGLRSLPCGSRLFPRTLSLWCGVCRGHTAPGRSLKLSCRYVDHDKSVRLASSGRPFPCGALAAGSIPGPTPGPSREFGGRGFFMSLYEPPH